MKAITLKQPWAAAMRSGIKRIETRSWPTKHRGALAIHAGRSLDRGALRLAITGNGGNYVSLQDVEAVERWIATHGPIVTGAAIGVMNLVDCIQMDQELIDAPEMASELPWGGWAPGRWAWVLQPIEWFAEPIPAKGRLGLWEWPAAPVVERKVRRFFETSSYKLEP